MEISVKSGMRLTTQTARALGQAGSASTVFSGRVSCHSAAASPRALSSTEHRCTRPRAKLRWEHLNGVLIDQNSNMKIKVLITSLRREEIQSSTGYKGKQ